MKRIMTNKNVDYIFHLVICTWKNFLFMGKPPGARFSKPSEHDYLEMVLRSRIGSTSECFPKHQTVHRKIIVCCPAQVHRNLCDIHR